MPFPPKRLNTYNPGRQLIDGSDMNNIYDAYQSSQQLTPAGAAQGTATVINAALVELLTAATAGVLLPISYPGAEVLILNNSGNAQNIYPNGTDQINAGGASTPISLASAASAGYRCIKVGFWQRFISS